MAFEKIAEEIIKEAMARGEFSDLSGKGKPLNLIDAKTGGARRKSSEYILLPA